MFWLKQCPRCGGDLHDARDWFGAYITCLQCGLNKDLMDRPVDPQALSFEPVSPPVILRSNSGKRHRLSHGGRHSSKTFMPSGMPTPAA